MGSGIALIGATILSACGAIACEGEHRRKAFYLLKPLTTMLIIVLLWTLRGAESSDQKYLCTAMLGCLVGDLALMGRSERAFTIGLAAFLIAHLIFIAAFARGITTFALPAWAWLAAPYALLGIWVLWPRAGALRAPVLVYIAVLLAMWLTAAARVHAGIDSRAWLALSGASVFVLSDSVLAWQRFVGAFRGADLLVLSSYYLAMVLIALSAGAPG